MEIFNIGLPEILIFLLIAFVLLGPKDMVLTAYKIGQAIRKFVRSPVWREILHSAQEIRELPTKLMDESGLKEELEAIQKDTREAVQEVNASVKEAVEAARVPEAEHIRLETGPTIAPADGTVTASGPTYPPPVTPKKEELPAMPAVFDGPPVPGLARFPTPAAVEQPAAVDEPPAVSETPAAVDEPPAVSESPAAVPPRKRAPRKKKEEVPAPPVEAAEPPAVADQPVVDEAPAVSESPAAGEAAVPPRKRAPRKKAAAEPLTPEVEAVLARPADEGEASTRARRARARKNGAAPEAEAAQGER